MRPYNLQWETVIVYRASRKDNSVSIWHDEFWFVAIEMFRIIKNLSPTTEFISQYIYSNIFSEPWWGQYFTKVKEFYF